MIDAAETGSTESNVAGPGRILRRARELRGLSVEDVADALKLKPRQIAALENEDFASFGTQTFARGFVRNYARHLNIDPARLLSAMDSLNAEAEVTLTPPSNARGDMPSRDPARGAPRSLAILAVVAFIALIGLMVYDRLRQPAGAPDSSATAPDASASPAPVAASGPAALPPAATSPDQTKLASTAGEAAQPAAAGVAPAASSDSVAPKPPAAEDPGTRQATAAESTGGRAQAAPGRLVLRFKRDAWIEIKDGSGRVLVSRTHAGGSSREVEGVPPFALTIGNASNVEVEYRGNIIDLAPHSALDIARLKLE